MDEKEINIHKPYYIIFVESNIEKMFLQKLNEKVSFAKYSIIFKELTNIKESTDRKQLNQTSRYKLLNLIYYLIGDEEIEDEAKYFYKLVENRLDILNNSTESKLIDLIEIISENNQLDNFFGLLNKRDSIIKYGRKKRIIYPDRYDIGNYIYDPFHIYLVIEKNFPTCELLKVTKKSQFVKYSKEWHQELLEHFTNLLKNTISNDSKTNYEKTSVKFLHPDIVLEYEEFILSKPSNNLLACYKEILGEVIFNETIKDEKIFLEKLFKEEEFLLIPEELKENFENVINGKVFKNESKNSPYPEIVAYLRKKNTLNKTDDDIIKDLSDNNNNFLKQILMPDRDLNTGLHDLFSNKKFKVIETLKNKVEKENLIETIKNEAVKQLDYLFEYHNEFDKTTLERIYYNFDYLYDGFEFFEIDNKAIDYFKNELKKISDDFFPPD